MYSPNIVWLIVVWMQAIEGYIRRYPFSETQCYRHRDYNTGNNYDLATQTLRSAAVHYSHCNESSVNIVIN